MSRWAVELATGLFVVQLLLLSLPTNQVDGARSRSRKQRSKPASLQAQQPSSDYDYDYYESYDEYEEKNGEPCFLVA